MPAFVGYVYRGLGEDTLTGHLTEAELGVVYPGPSEAHPRCDGCGYRLASRNHRRLCR